MCLKHWLCLVKLEYKIVYHLHYSDIWYYNDVKKVGSCKHKGTKNGSLRNTVVTIVKTYIYYEGKQV